MKRIALIFLSIMSLMACKDEPVEDPNKKENPEIENKLTLNIHIPKNSASTYANEFASTGENRIDSICVDLYQGAAPGTMINRTWFKGPSMVITDDTIITVGYEVDNITTGALRVEVFANMEIPKLITDEIINPNVSITNPFYMSGRGNIIQSGTSYKGEVHLIRNVAKLRTNVSLNSVFIPSDLVINYSGIKIEVLHTPNNTATFENTPGFPGIGFTPYTERGPSPLQPLRYASSPAFTPTGGGQVDSLYLYENLNSTTQKTIVRVTIPTESASEGNKTAFYDYELYTKIPGDPLTYDIIRNYIYILDIKVRGQSLDPLITLDIEPWNEVALDGSIFGTYLTTDVSEIIFDSNGEATINFCTDAQAVYFDFTTFNINNPSTTLGFDPVTNSITPDNGIVPADPALAPTGFKSGQLLLDQQHCGSFKFKLKLSDFPGFPNVDFSGSICVKAGNIVKCFTFPGINMYDAHFIVGEPLFSGESFSSAQVDGGANGWLEISRSRLYTGASANIPSGTGPIYLHLNENLTGLIRSGSITLTGSNGTKKINLSQLPAIRVGRFGYSSSTLNYNSNKDSLYDADLYMEQLYEFSAMPIYINGTNTTPTLVNSVFHGRRSAISVFDWTRYSAPFDYQSTLYQAINYCAQKNRIASDASKEADLKWYLPSQAQLTGMWIAHNLPNDTIKNSTFVITTTNNPSEPYWSSTKNDLYTNEAQYLNFIHGNVGHNINSNKSWVRCVRDGRSTPSMTTNGSSVINFGIGSMPAGTYSSTPKSSTIENELGGKNATLFQRLRVSNADIVVSGNVSTSWSTTLCDGTIENTTGWRLPTQRELQAIWILQSEINANNSLFNLLGNDYYWSQTESSSYPTNVWVVYGSRNIPGDSGNAPHRLKTEKSRVRCVRETP